MDTDTNAESNGNIDGDILLALRDSAVAAKGVAYCIEDEERERRKLLLGPYSNFRVGAAFLTDDGTIVSGANVENASFPVGMCAERCALARGVTDGHRNYKALVVATDIAPPASPCGMCRQFIREFCPLSMPIYMYDGEGRYVVRRLEELLPMSFGPDDLKGSGDGGGTEGGG